MSLKLPDVVVKALQDVVNELVKIRKFSYVSNMLYRSVSHYIYNKGKLIRPTLTLLTSYLLDGDLSKAVKAAVAIECVHIATLLQDDVFDHHTHRRGTYTPRYLYGDNYSILASNVFIAKAVEYSVDTGIREIPIEISKTALDLSDGEALELEYRDGFKNIKLGDYFTIIRKKTASLIEASMVVGAYTAYNVSKSTIDRVRIIGRLLGMLYQIRDDIHDFLEDNMEYINIVNVFIRSGFSRDEALRKSVKIFEKLFNYVKDLTYRTFHTRAEILHTILDVHLRLHIVDLF